MDFALPPDIENKKLKYIVLGDQEVGKSSLI